MLANNMRLKRNVPPIPAHHGSFAQEATMQALMDTILDTADFNTRRILLARYTLARMEHDTRKMVNSADLVKRTRRALADRVLAIEEPQKRHGNYLEAAV